MPTGVYARGYRECSVEGCVRKHRTRGFCDMHHKRWMRYGDPLVVRQVKVPPREFCTIEGCGKPHAARGWCVNHYTLWRNNGDPLVTRKAKHGEGDSYGVTHERLKAIRGRPQECEWCGDTSDRVYQWALRHDTSADIRRDATGTYSLNLDDYVRLCVPCHVRFDRRKENVA